ncbi:hypothetical protein EX30DRAFT_385584 [Ascodesmis nigricans]|uniref:Uncharacterized protein n=1 Tax=Ascodesmis nigricans TaxID=341454 RepID=A0A4S2MMQ0_9PEZI|nr:hypothetical protein EX30DRAFT_385584 [Ascodesmis nigricans]
MVVTHRREVSGPWAQKMDDSFPRDMILHAPNYEREDDARGAGDMVWKMRGRRRRDNRRGKTMAGRRPPPIRGEWRGDLFCGGGGGGGVGILSWTLRPRPCVRELRAGCALQR